MDWINLIIALSAPLTAVIGLVTAVVAYLAAKQEYIMAHEQNEKERQTSSPRKQK